MKASGVQRENLERVAPRIQAELAGLAPAKCVRAAIPDGAVPDPALPWVPWHILPPAAAPFFASLDPAARLRYNHYYALMIVEEFIWLENELVLAPLRRLLSGRLLPEDARRLFESFIHDENHHNATLWRLSHAARPDLYPGGDAYPASAPAHVLFRPPRALTAAAALFARFPHTLGGWVLMVNGFEEQSLLLYRAYESCKDGVDPLFRHVHFLHAQDEARHCHLDTLLEAILLDGQPRWANALNGAVLGFAMRRYFDTRWGYHEIVRRLAQDFPELKPHQDRLLRETARGRQGAPYFEQLFGEKTAPMAWRNRRRYAIFDRAVRSLAPEPRSGA